MMCKTNVNLKKINLKRIGALYASNHMTVFKKQLINSGKLSEEEFWSEVHKFDLTPQQVNEVEDIVRQAISESDEDYRDRLRMQTDALNAQAAKLRSLSRRLEQIRRQK